MDVENNFRAAVDDTRRWAAIIGHDSSVLFLVEEEEVVSRSMSNHNLQRVDEICFTSSGYCCRCKLLN